MENCGTDKIYIDFMKPSWRFPVYWTEEWDMKHTMAQRWQLFG